MSGLCARDRGGVGGGILAGVGDPMAEQIAYYRARADEYDGTFGLDPAAAAAWFADVVDEFAPRGDLLEIACGTGLWTEHLVRYAERVTAVDSSPEMVARARARAPDAKFVVADVFGWEPERRFDSIFFGFWLSHVPDELFAAFWQRLERWLAPRGRVLVVDEGAPRGAGKTCTSPGRVARRLRDGTEYEIVKFFHDVHDLESRLVQLGWSPDLWLTDDGFLIGTAVPTGRRAR